MEKILQDKDMQMEPCQEKKQMKKKEKEMEKIYIYKISNNREITSNNTKFIYIYICGKPEMERRY